MGDIIFFLLRFKIILLQNPQNILFINIFSILLSQTLGHHQILMDKNNLNLMQNLNKNISHFNYNTYKLNISHENLIPNYLTNGNQELIKNNHFTTNNTKYSNSYENNELIKTNDKDKLKSFLYKFFYNIMKLDSAKLYPNLLTGIKQQKNSTIKGNYLNNHSTKLNQRSFDVDLLRNNFNKINKNYDNNVNLPRAMETGRLFIFKGLKKLLWPLFIGVQIAKSILLALFLPSILGSIGKMVGKGISSVSGFNHPSETVSDFEFKDNMYNFDDDMKNTMDFNYPRPEASTNHFTTQLYGNGGNMMMTDSKNNVLSRFGYNDNKISYSNKVDVTSNQYDYKNSDLNNLNKNSYKDFLKVPSSSLLLSNYDPFYSPLLSRIDSVFSRLNLDKKDEVCREKLICLMYSNPAKYAPYSNLISAQLSRELNELKKPTSDSEEILRFFKYMRAAKDGQDGLDCEKEYNDCKNDSLNDSAEPIMITTYNDINKLVQARKFN